MVVVVAVAFSDTCIIEGLVRIRILMTVYIHTYIHIHCFSKQVYHPTTNDSLEVVQVIFGTIITE